MTPSESKTKATLSDSHDSLLAHESAGLIQRYVFPKGTVLFRKGELRQCAYLIDRGSVSITGNDEGGEDKFLCHIGEGEIFGEMALVDDTPRTATAITDTECEIFIIPRDALQNRLQGLDPIVTLLISLLIERYRLTRIHLPESLRQDKDSDQFMNKLKRYHHITENSLKIHDISTQKDNALRELKIEQELRKGLERREFIPFLQPIIDLKTRRVKGFEALIRWQHPEKGLVFPDQFIPAAEHTNVVQQLDRLMLEKACETLPLLDEIGGHDMFISVNMSGINFNTQDIVQSMSNVVKRYNANPRRLKLEITESALIDDPAHAAEVLQGLKEAGFMIALDDFGTGYSSLGYLHRFTIDVIKIDRSFVSRLHDNEKSMEIVSAIIGLAKTFHLGTIAEGIEQEPDIETLCNLGCTLGQGYFFSKPLPVKDAVAYAAKDNV
jgi:EAL domain-containing protein (putative c-di-GMP-specific phosphodiesterase class I)